MKTDAERAAWLADKIVAQGDYAKEAAAMLRRWPSGMTDEQRNAIKETIAGLAFICDIRDTGQLVDHVIRLIEEK